MKFVIGMEIDLPEIDLPEIEGTPLPPGFVEDTRVYYQDEIARHIVGKVNDLRCGEQQECTLSGMPVPASLETRKRWNGSAMIRCPECMTSNGTPSMVRVTQAGKVFKHAGYRWPGGPAVQFGSTGYAEAMRARYLAAREATE